MERKRIKKILRDLSSGKTSLDKAMEELKAFPYHDMGFAKMDTHRELRKGFPEVVLCRGKSLSQVKAIFSKSPRGATIMATRAGEDVYEAVRQVRGDAVYFKEARVILAGKKRPARGRSVVVATAGTADIPVAEEAAVTAEIMGNRVRRIYDVGVAGAHRMLLNRDEFEKASVVIVAAGMDGVLPSVVGGVVSRPVIAVPTSVGYGANFGGLAPLLTMLNSCAPGVSVVNVDNGFGAGYLASLINRK